MFTCPICDWRVKIPRDAARPKLEDLQNWQEEIPDLPFQPEEEETLKGIVGKAQAFRDFLQRFTNGSQLCRTSNEMPEMLFYLRKLEGADVLLAFETNLFRQELHKYNPIAPQPPPILEQSLSTRKPRPTKQQKLMKEHGVQKPEDLPPHLRTKTYVRRKTQDSFASGPLLPKLSTQSPSAPGSAASPAQSQAPHRSDTPTGMPRQASTGNAPTNPAFEPGFVSNGIKTSSPFPSAYATAGPSFPATTPSPMFSPTGSGSQPPEGMRETLPFSSGLTSDGRPHDPSFPLFQPSVGLGLDGDDDIRSGLANVGNTVATHQGLSPHADSIFMDMTNHDNDAYDVPGLDHEASHASEALEMIRSASNDSSKDQGDVLDGDHVSSKDNFDEFLTTGDDQS